MNDFGAIFDWDGVIIDSSRQHEKSWELLALEEGLILPEGHFQKGFGMKNELVIPNVLGWTDMRDEISRLSLRKEELYRDIIAEVGIEPLPGVVPFLDYLQSLRIPCAIGSSSHKVNIQMVMQRLELGDYFEAIITGEDVTASKPDPQCFVLAAQELGCSPTNCIVFEDAPAGVAAAHAGGMKVVAVATTHPQYDLTEADIVVHQLDELNRSHLEDLLYHENKPVL